MQVQDRNAEIITTYIVKSDWGKKFKERVKTRAAAKHDIVQENTL